jgi:tetratricopeptide (TPR) repeat protein
LNPANPKLYEICGSAALMLKNFNEALEYFQRSIQLNKGLTNLISANLMSHGASFVEDHTDYEVTIIFIIRIRKLKRIYSNSGFVFEIACTKMLTILL